MSEKRGKQKKVKTEWTERIQLIDMFAVKLCIYPSIPKPMHLFKNEYMATHIMINMLWTRKETHSEICNWIKVSSRNGQKNEEKKMPNFMQIFN